MITKALQIAEALPNWSNWWNSCRWIKLSYM